VHGVVEAAAASDRALRNLIALARANTHFAHAAALGSAAPFLHTCKCNGPIIFGARLDTPVMRDPLTYFLSPICWLTSICV
jgi:hypothetical protein